MNSLNKNTKNGSELRTKTYVSIIHPDNEDCRCVSCFCIPNDAKANIETF